MRNFYGGLTGLWLGRFAPERFYGLVVANTAARIGDQASWLSRARAVRQEGMDVSPQARRIAGLPTRFVRRRRKWWPRSVTS
ncbi:beta-ketoadipate enol-lactone hydrolase [Klebsiella grimontii]|uniref:Beta-ketoadipate enol-lactone hydrolase n=1 Tax=Klebsiella grimontii TaxID=2058152 RepID=A0A7H4P2V4_9ENTR|nr:beta-ketoadipate enol-lactone hydrolase [Klebsiella grimontii]